MEPFYLHQRSDAAAPGSVASARGFTLVEMLVVLAIIMVVTSVVLVGRSNFDNTIIVSNTAYDIALTFRDTENYGVGSRAIQGLVNTGYGMHFSNSTPTSFLVFADTYPATFNQACHPATKVGGSYPPDAKPGNCIYNAGNDLQVQTYTLGNGAKISDVCAQFFGSWYCQNARTAKLTSLDVTFVRPNSTTFIVKNGVYSSAKPGTQACIAISSVQGVTRYVSLNQSGLITASATSCIPSPYPS